MRFPIGPLPPEPVAAAAAFYAEVAPLLERALIEPLKENGAEAEPVTAEAILAHDALPPEPPAPEPAPDELLLLVFLPADHTHRAWRVAAVQGLARAHAPLRVNAIASEDAAATAAAERYLAEAPGVTGQYWAIDGNGAGPVLS